MNTFVFYISGHGFGHATRNLEVINHISEVSPAARIIIRSSVPSWFIERGVRRPVELQPCDTDTGVMQIDSLRLDEDETARRALTFYSTFAQRVGEEAAVLRRLGAAVVVGDVPPLAFAAAARAGVPSVAFSNFTWDWIYEEYADFDAEAPGVLETIRDAYATTSLALRLPFYGGFDPMQEVTVDVPLVARRSRLGREETRRRLDLDRGVPIVLASFGGHGAAMPYADIVRDNDITLVLTEHEHPGVDVARGRLRCFAGSDLVTHNVRYEDLVAAADVVVSKPGYGIVSECIANGTAFLYTSRGHFAENDVLVSGMQRVMRCQYIDQEDLRAGRWQESIESLLGQSEPAEQMDVAGAPIVAATIAAAASNTIGF